MIKPIQPFWINKGSVRFNGVLYDQEKLNALVEQMNEYLLQHQYKKDQIVGICLDRSVELLSLLYALLQRGIPFFLISGNSPEARQDYMIHHIGVSHIITEEKYRYKFSGMQTILVDEIKKTGKIVRKQSEYHNAEEGDIAYYIYTSGSTGRPKAVEITQGNLRNIVKELPKKIVFEKGSHILNLSAVTFDLFIVESVFAMQQGFEVILPMEEERADIAGLYKLLQKNEVDVIEVTPSHLRILHAYDNQFTVLKGIKHILIGGEKFPEYLLPVLQKNSECKIYNMYGITETTIWASVADLSKECEIHIGEPINGYEFLVLNKSGEACKEGETGELYISGKGVANGYKNDSLLTEKRFMKSSFNKAARMYKTGDLVRYENGKYFYLGRYDNQIKYGGNRIELEEIDEACMAVPEIKNALVYFIEEGQYLLALYESEEELGQDYLLSCLRKTLFDYMLPKCFIKAEKLYFNENGKLDRKKNYQLYIEARELMKEKEEKNSSTEGRVLEVVREILPKEDIEIQAEDALQDIGIDSINFIRLVIALEENFKLNFNEEILSMQSFERIEDIITYIKTQSKE